MLLVISSMAQTSYFGNVHLVADKLEAFKKTTTLFTLPYADYKELDKFEEAIKNSWTITPYKIIKPEELANYQTSPDYSFFYLDTYTDQVDTIVNQNLVYGLKMISPTEKPKQMQETTLATITLFPDAVSNLQIAWVTEQGGSKRAVKSKQLGILYNHSKFLNWSAGLLTGYLKQINDGLLLKQTRGLDYQFYNKIRVPELVEETLYIPEYVREVFSSQPVTLEQAPVEERYRYKFKFVTNAVLDSLILKKGSSIKYLVYTKRSNDKIISIYDSKDGLLIYQMFSFQSPNFSMNDLNNIKKTIKEIEK
ncbi:hypothetical protein [Pedobacter sp. N23S346]|uniref:hypothetical protein n=1 Tax=Pedobacter sp. N23S346 TaxID=3402750 RepID=UPI003ACE3677